MNLSISCSTCGGSGSVSKRKRIGEMVTEEYVSVKCSTCGGSGRTYYSSGTGRVWPYVATAALVLLGAGAWALQFDLEALKRIRWDHNAIDWVPSRDSRMMIALATSFILPIFPALLVNWMLEDVSLSHAARSFIIIAVILAGGAAAAFLVGWLLTDSLVGTIIHWVLIAILTGWFILMTRG